MPTALLTVFQWLPITLMGENPRLLIQLKRPCKGAPGWLSQLSTWLFSALVMISRSWDQDLHWLCAEYGVCLWFFLWPLPCSLSLSQIKKDPFRTGYCLLLCLYFIQSGSHSLQWELQRASQGFPALANHSFASGPLYTVFLLEITLFFIHILYSTSFLNTDRGSCSSSVTV